MQQEKYQLYIINPEKLGIIYQIIDLTKIEIISGEFNKIIHTNHLNTPVIWGKSDTYLNFAAEDKISKSKQYLLMKKKTILILHRVMYIECL